MTAQERKFLDRIMTVLYDVGQVPWDDGGARQTVKLVNHQLFMALSTMLVDGDQAEANLSLEDAEAEIGPYRVLSSKPTGS